MVFIDSPDLVALSTNNLTPFSIARSTSSLISSSEVIFSDCGLVFLVLVHTGLFPARICRQDSKLFYKLLEYYGVNYLSGNLRNNIQIMLEEDF